MKILLLEDDISLVEGLEYALKKEGFEVVITRTVHEAIDTFRPDLFDFVLLDLTLPDGSGFEVCRKIRSISQVPIVFLTATDEEVTTVMGLDMGGDDYITKPFKLNELISRIKAILRRSQRTEHMLSSDILECKDLRMNLLTGKVTLNDTVLDLTVAEYKMLSFFLQNKGVLLTRTVLLNRLWDDNGDFVDDNTLSVYIKRLRTKIEPNPSSPIYIKTIRGLGYRFGENL